MTPYEQQRLFLELVRTGPGYAAFLNAGSVFTQCWFTDDEQALRLINQYSQTHNLWVSMAKYSDANKARTADNAEGLCSFWLDVDAHEGSRYASPAEAETAVFEFFRVTELPQPNLINRTGHGVQAFWALDKALSRAEWEPTARRLQFLAEAHYLDADPITADAARVLRVPGTQNFRNPDTPVMAELVILNDGYINLDEFETALNAAVEKLPPQATKPKPTKPNTKFEHPNTPENIAIVKAMLGKIDPDPARNTWETIVYTKPGPLGGICRRIDYYGLSDGGGLNCGHSQNIPAQLRAMKNWIWLEPSPENGKSEIYLCRGVKPEESLSPKNYLGSYCESIDLAGSALVLSNTPLSNGLFLVAIEIGPGSGLSSKDVSNLWLALGCPYIERSFEKDLWTIIGLVRSKLPTKTGEGFSIFTSGYAVLSGLGGRGDLKDITDELAGLEAFRKPLNPQSTSLGLKDITRPDLEALLRRISADCNYSEYRNVVWAILSTGCPSAEEIARNWSKTAPHRFDERCFNSLVNAYNPSLAKSPTLGTIIHYARRSDGHA